MVPAVLRINARLAMARRGVCFRSVVVALIPAWLVLPSSRGALFARSAWWRSVELRPYTRLRATGLQQAPSTATVSVADTLEELASAAPLAVDKLARQVESLRRQLKDPAEADDWQTKGNALVAAPKSLKWRRGMTEVVIPDYSQWDKNGNPLSVTIELLDPEKDFQANAKLCFKKAGKITRAWKKLVPIIEETEKQAEQWRGNAEQVKKWQAELQKSGVLSTSTESKAEALREQLVQQGLLQSRKPPESERPVDRAAEERRAFKRKYGKDIDCFRSPGGHEVIAGRSSTMNEYVSLKLAKGDMPWFHTDNGIPGSHVLIKAPWNDVSEEDFEFAAKIAAYHSKKKTSFHVPVMYCKGGDVKKPPGSPKGTVSTSGQRYQMTVTPGLPDDDDA